MIITLSNRYQIIVDGIFNPVTGELTAAAIDEIRFFNGDSWGLEKILDDASKGTVKNDFLHGYPVDDNLAGYDGDDVINGYLGNDTLNGNAGRDRLWGGSGNDVLDGGSGKDFLYGGMGDDKYVINKDSGYDVINDDGGIDSIRFAEGISPDDIYVAKSRSGMYLFSRFGQVTCIALSPDNELKSIEKLLFYNNEVWDSEKINQRIQETLINPDIILPQGLTNSLFIDGFRFLEGEFPVAIKDSGGQYKYLLAGVGAVDHSAKSGTYYAYEGSVNFLSYFTREKIIFADGSDPQDIKIDMHWPYNSSYQIRLTSVKSGVTIFLSGVFYYDNGEFPLREYSDASLETPIIQFLNGDEWTYKDVLERFSAATDGNDSIFAFKNVALHDDVLNGGYGNDSIEGSWRDETLIGGAGEDVIASGGGNDFVSGGTGNEILFGGTGKNIFEFSVGDGIDTIRTSAGGNEIIQFGEGVNPSDLVIERTADGHISISYSPTDKILLESVFLNTASNKPKIDNLIDKLTFLNAPDVDFLQLLNSLGFDVLRPTISNIKFDSTGSKVTGIATPGAEIYLDLVSSGGQWRAFSDSVTGAFVIELGIAYINSQAFSIKAVDSGFNASTNVSIKSPDLTRPTKPSATLSTDGKVISGTGEVGSIVVVKNSTTNVEIASVTILNTNGKYSLNLPLPLVNGEKIAVFSKDVSENVSDSVALTAKDTTAPNIPTASFDATGKIITGNAEAGSTVIARNAGGSQLKTAIADASGTYTITLNTSLTNGEVVKVTAKDTAGNISPPNSINAPDKTPPLLQKAIFDAASAGKIITGTAEKGSTVIVMTTGGVELKTGVANASTGAYSITLDTALINKELVDVIAKDDAGNPSTAIQITAPDKTRPAAPSANIDTTRKIISGFAEAGSKVIIKNNVGTILKSVTANATTGAYSATLSTALAVGQTVFITATDVATNISEQTTFIVGSGVVTPPDTTRPAIPDAVFDSTGQIVTGSAEPGALVVIRNAADTEIGSIRAHATTGVYSITLATGLINKETVKVTAKDVAGNVSDPMPIVAPDKTQPAAPSVTLDEENKIASGNAEPGSWVEIKNAANTVIGSVQANPSTGAFSITLSQTLTNGQSIFTTAKDADGNVSPMTETQAIIEEPPQPTSSGLRGSYYGYHQSSNGNINLTNVAQVLTYITGKTPAATFVAKNLQYSSGSPLGIGSSLQTFLKTDAVSLSKDPANTSDAIIKLDGKIKLDSGIYNFRVRADDGYSIRLNGAIVAEYNANQTATTRTHAAFTITQSGLQDIEIIYWDEGNNAALNVELGNTAGTYRYLSDDILFQPAAPAAIMSSNALAERDYDAVHYFNQNHALIQAMAAFAPESGVDTRYRAAYADSNQLMIAVGQ